jgi:hypothetical protein
MGILVDFIVDVADGFLLDLFIPSRRRKRKQSKRE